jgi:hypothetical protein
MKSLNEAIKKIEETIDMMVENSYIATQYIQFDNKGTTWTVRVADHPANPERIDNNTISLVIDKPETETEDSGNWGVSKKQFQPIDNQYSLDMFGQFTEQFSSVEQLLNYHL